MGNYITFDGVSSSSYDIMISGEGVFDAPKRDVEMVTIPGRNGSFVLDKGRFENIEVTYPGTNHEPDNISNFRTKLANFRNALASRKGYKRLTDTFHPDEFRLAAFKDGLEVNTVGQAMASEFDIVFDCKPQRYLTSGETAVSVASGGTITNPTLFESQPILQVWGFGDLTITKPDGSTDTIKVENVPIGEVVLRNSSSLKQSTMPKSYNLPLETFETGDEFSVDGMQFKAVILNVTSGYYSGTPSVTNSNAEFTVDLLIKGTLGQYGRSLAVDESAPSSELTFAKGTSKTVSNTATIKMDSTQICQLRHRVIYDGTSTLTFRLDILNARSTETLWGDQYSKFEKISGISTQSALGTPLYIDCEYGECYKIENGATILENSAVSLEAELPTLQSGVNTITYDNTITQFKIVPRWWRI